MVSVSRSRVVTLSDMATLTAFHLKNYAIESSIRLAWLAQLGRSLTLGVQDAERRDNQELLTALLEVKNKINQALAAELKRLRLN